MSQPQGLSLAAPFTPTRHARPRPPRTTRSIVDRFARIAVAAMIVLGASLLVMNEFAFRTFEALLAGVVVTPFVSGDTTMGIDRFNIWVEPDQMISFKVTVECTALIILVPLLIIAAVMLAATSVRWRRALTAMGAMVMVVMVVNLLRLAFIGFAAQKWGMDVGFPLAHSFVGSVIGVLGFAAGLAALIVIMGSRGRKPRR